MFSGTSLEGYFYFPNATGVYNGTFYKTKISSFIAPNLNAFSSGNNYDQGTFAQISNLKKVNIGTIVTTIPGFSFYECSNLKEIQCGNITTIGNNALKGTSKQLNKNILKSTITSIGNYAFYDSGLEDGVINFPNLTTLGTSAFRATKITQVLNLGSITALNNTNNEGVFYNCYNLTKCVLPQGLTSIGQNTFYNCSALESINVTIPTGEVSGFKSYVLGLELENLTSFIINGEEVEL